jgi:hypothetical protein
LQTVDASWGNFSNAKSVCLGQEPWYILLAICRSLVYRLKIVLIFCLFPQAHTEFPSCESMIYQN